MHRTRVKICGLTRAEDALACVRAGADAIGLVFVPKSPRCVSIEQAAAVLAVLPPFVASVALFQNAGADYVRAVLAHLSPTLLQFHGDEPREYCAGFGRGYLRAVPMGAGAEVDDYARRFPDAAGLLLDSHGGERSGGSGESFDWSRVPARRTLPIVLAGGLEPDNVAHAIYRVRPWAVDVSSGVEAAKGIKDARKIGAFMQAVRNGDDRG